MQWVRWLRYRGDGAGRACCDARVGACAGGVSFVLRRGGNHRRATSDAGFASGSYPAFVAVNLSGGRRKSAMAGGNVHLGEGLPGPGSPTFPVNRTKVTFRGSVSCRTPSATGVHGVGGEHTGMFRCLCPFYSSPG